LIQQLSNLVKKPTNAIIMDMKKYIIYLNILNIISILFLAQICLCQQTDADQAFYISKLNITGNKAISSKKVIEILNINHRQRFEPVIIENSILDLLNTYKKIGYMFTKVTWDHTIEKRNTVVINIAIQEGEKVFMGNIDFVYTGDQPLKQSTIKKLSIQKSQYFDESILEKDIYQIMNLYGEKGYPLASVSPEINIENGKINLILRVDSGIKTKIGEIKIEGLKKTKENIILRELPIRSGDIFDQKKVDETERLLNNMGYFQNVYPISFSNIDDENLMLYISVIEGPTGRINGLLGYNPSDNENESKLIGMVDGSETNLFGTARKIKISGRRGFVNSYEFAFVEPWIINKPIDLGIHFQAIDRSEIQIRQKLIEREAGLSGTMRIGSHDQIYVIGKYKRINSSELSEELFEIPDTKIPNEELANGRKYSIGIGSRFDNRDYFNNPTKGRFTDAVLELSLGDFRLIRFWFDINFYFKTLEQQVLALGIHAGRIWGDSIPITELFYLGGANSLRGYREDQFRGYERQFGNIEYRFLTGRNSHFFIFLDGGRVYTRDKESGKIKLGYGAGMRLESVNGTLSVDYGLAKGDSILKGKIHVSLGAVF